MFICVLGTGAQGASGDGSRRHHLCEERLGVSYDKHSLSQAEIVL